MTNFEFLKDGDEDDGTIRINTSRPRRPQPVQRKTAAKPGALSQAASALLIAAMIGGCVTCVSRMPEQTQAQFDAKDHRILAVHCAQSHVTTMLRSPRSAKWPGLFSGFENHAKQNGDGTYTVCSWVDADNALGASIRMWFRVRLRLRKSGGADIITAEFQNVDN